MGTKFRRRTSKAIPIAIACALLAGCAATTAPKVQPETNMYNDDLWPEIALFWKLPSEMLKIRCIEFDNSSALHQCDTQFLNLNYELKQLKESNYFTDVRYADKSTKYSIAITKAMFIDENAGDIAAGALAGATLMLVPMSQNHKVTVEVVIRWRDTVIKVIEYDLDFELTISLFHNPEQAKIDLAGQISAKIIQDIKKDDVLSGRYLASRLQSSDYSNGLMIPERVGQYSKIDEMVQGGPLEGIAFSYVRPEFKFDEYLIGIYPIRATSWDDHTEVLSGELKQIRSDFEIAAKEGRWQSVRFEDQREAPNYSSTVDHAGLSQSVKLVDDTGVQMAGRVYLFIQEDKIVRLSNIVPVEYEQPEPQVFLSSFLKELVVPNESLFMAKLRQQQRKSEFR